MSEDQRLLVNDFAKQLFTLLSQAGKLVVKLTGEDGHELHYYRALYPSLFHGDLQVVSARMAQLGGSLFLQKAQERGRAEVAAPSNPAEDYADRITEILDDYLEEVDHQLDLLHGRIREPQIRASLQPPPRNKFRMKPAAPNIIRPSDTQIYEPEDNPHEQTIRSLTFEGLLGPVEEPECLELEEAPCLWVDTVAALAAASEDLMTQDVIAVDLEHHSLYSYYGLTCLIQISTRTKDYLIDAIKLRSEILPLLGPVFHSPAILKVFHGAESDNIWLQRDFNIFVVGMFDTYFAAKAIGGFPRFSYAHLLEHYCGVQVDKTHQISDWRQRPLPDDMLLYARQDTHYLIYVYERMKMDLLDKAGGEPKELLAVLRRSSLQSLVLFKAERPEKDSWRVVIQRSSVPFNRLQLEKVRAIYEWRDRCAREEDVSLHALLPNQFIIRVAQAMPRSDPALALQVVGHDFSLALKHIDELQRTIQELEESSSASTLTPRPDAPVTSCAPGHIIFADDDDDSRLALMPVAPPPPVPSRSGPELKLANPVSIAATIKSTKRKGSSLMGAFSSSSNPGPFADASAIVPHLEISKVARAAQSLMTETKTSARPAEGDSTEDAGNAEAALDNEPRLKVAKSMAGGHEWKEEQVLEETDRSRILAIPLSRSQKAHPSIRPFDYASAHRPTPESPAMGAESGVVSNSAPASQAAPTAGRGSSSAPPIEEPDFETSQKAPKISNKPRSGNRSMTFY